MAESSNLTSVMARQVFAEEIVIRKSIIANELFVDALRNIIGKRRLHTGDEEILLNAMFPNDQPIPSSWCLENGTTSIEPEKNIPQLKALVERELNDLFDVMDGLDEMAGIREMDASFDLGELKSAASALTTTSVILPKQYKTLHSLRTKEFVSPLLKSLDALSSLANEVHHQLREMENEMMTEMFGEASEEELEAIADHLKETLKTLSSEESAVYEELDKYEEDREDLLSVAQQLNEVERQIELTKAAIKVLLDGTLGD